jgi:uncharacterized DUF497 family protein
MSHPLDDCESFDWNKGNSEKIWLRHQVMRNECEDVFFHPRVIVDVPLAESLLETRYQVLGITNAGRRLFLVVTIRKNKIRVISARDMNKKERQLYAQAIKTHPQV